jgi:hypothetical protein
MREKPIPNSVEPGDLLAEIASTFAVGIARRNRRAVSSDATLEIPGQHLEQSARMRLTVTGGLRPESLKPENTE